MPRYYSARTALQAGQAVQGYIQTQYFTPVNAGLVSTATPFVAVPTQLSNKSLSSFDYTFAGCSVLPFWLGHLWAINIFPELKKMGILRRLHTTAAARVAVLLSIMMGNAVVGMLSLGSCLPWPLASSTSRWWAITLSWLCF